MGWLTNGDGSGDYPSGRGYCWGFTYEAAVVLAGRWLFDIIIICEENYDVECER